MPTETLGLETLRLRAQRSCENALAIAQYLASSHKKVRAVNYPGLPSSQFHVIAKRQFPHGLGGILTFTLMDRLQFIRRATNINDNKSLIIHPASTIYCEYSPIQREDMQVSESMLRLSVGIEDVDDIIENLDVGLSGW